jgi:hypothetical protein
MVGVVEQIAEIKALFRGGATVDRTPAPTKGPS